MKRVILPMTALAAFVITTSTFADDNSALETQVSQLSAQTQQLQQQVLLLQKKLNAKKHKKAAKKAAKTQTTQTPPSASQVGLSQTPQSVGKAQALHPTTLQPWPNYVTFTTAPFLGNKTAYNGSDLLYNLTSINEDLTLLQHNQVIINQMAQQGYKLDRPVIEASGALVGQMETASGFGVGPNNTGISLSTGELDLHAIASSWATAFMAIDYTGGPTSTGNRAPNTSIYLSRGFATLGNLDVTPFYLTAGLMYVPFGAYSTGILSTPIVQSMGRINSPAVLVGYNPNANFNAQLYGYQGSQTSGPNNIVQQGGANAVYKYVFTNKNSISLGSGWVSNLADSQGSQNTGLVVPPGVPGQFAGFGVTPGSNNIAHQVNALDFNGQITVGDLSLIGEYIGADQSFATSDLSFDGAGAVPESEQAELDYILPWFAKKYGTTTGFSYGHSSEALGLNLPEDSYSVFLTTSLWRETTEGIEYRHDTNYSASSFASGNGATTNIDGTGTGRDEVLAQFGVFF